MLWHHRWCSKVQSQAQRVNMWPGSHIVTGDAHLWLESQICDRRRKMRLETQLCDCSSCKSTRGHAHQNSIYSRPIVSDFSFPSHVLLFFYASNQAIRYIVIHTRDSISQYYQGNSYTISLGWYHNTADTTYLLMRPLPGSFGRSWGSWEPLWGLAVLPGLW
jgi:hypothetical protein